MQPLKEHPIGVVARRTGLSAHVIRKWEQRYQVVAPRRNRSKRRFYSEEDIQRLRLLRQAVQTGHSIGQIARLPTEKLLEYIRADRLEQPVSDRQITEPGRPGREREVSIVSYLGECLGAAKRLDHRSLIDILEQAVVVLGQTVVIDRLLPELMQAIGRQWQDGSLRIIHEHLVTAATRTLLGRLLEAYDIPDSAPLIVIATPARQLHELGALAGAVAAAAGGWRVTYLGPNVPVEEIAAAVEIGKARFVLLSIGYPADEYRLKADLKSLRRYLSMEVAIIVGGTGAQQYRNTLQEIEIEVLKDFSELRERLRI